MHEGHRERMLKKLENYADALNEHELLEILLYFCIPRVNTNPVAHRLLESFGSIENVFDADIERLKTVEGVGPSVAAFLRTLGIFFDKYKKAKSPALPEKYDGLFEDYLRGYYRDYTYEQLTVFFLDEKKKILFCKSFTSKKEDSVHVSPPEITKCIGNHACYGVILAHNHIGASAKPSEDDDSFTKQCEMLLSINNVRLFDHLIVAGDEVYSYYKSGKMAKIAQEFHVRRLVGEKR